MPEVPVPRSDVRRLRATWLLYVLFIAGLDCQESSLRAAEPELKAVFPIACPSGDSVEITLVGSGLDQGGVLHFSRKDLSAEHIEKNRFRVTAVAESAVGDCDVWIATAQGLAGPRRFGVVRCPVIAEVEPNDTSDGSQEIAIPSTLCARLDKAADLDWFAFDGEQDQNITITCRSTSLDGSVQPTLTLFAPDGRQLAHSSFERLEPLLTVRLPVAGKYRLLMHDRAYRKDDFGFYQLELTSGSSAAATWQHMGILRPDDLFGSVPKFDEQAQSQHAPQSIELPCRIIGQFARRGDVDWFRFSVKKDDTVHIEAFGERLGQLMDLEASIHDNEAKEIVAIQDSSSPKGIPSILPLGSLDPALDWKVPSDGDYSLAIRDLYGGSVFGRDRSYELIVERQHPRFCVVALPSDNKPGRGISVRRGGEASASLIVFRTGGFSGAVTVRLAQPLDGLTVEAAQVDGKEVAQSIKISAAEDAPIGFQSLRLVAEAEIGSDIRVVPVVNAALIRSGITRRIDGMVVNVSE